jgi:hypothetical protein
MPIIPFMTARKTKRLGRPPAEFTPKQLRRIDNLALRQCKDTTIAEAMGVEVKTFQAHFSKRTRQKRAEGKTILHTNQFKMARKQPVMAIWLGKQHLDQSDKAELSGTMTQRVAVNIIANGKPLKADIVDDNAGTNRPADTSTPSPE